MIDIMSRLLRHAIPRITNVLINPNTIAVRRQCVTSLYSGQLRRYLVSSSATSSTNSFDPANYTTQANDKIKRLSSNTNRVECFVLPRTTINKTMKGYSRVLGMPSTDFYTMDNAVDDSICNYLTGNLLQSDLASFMVSPGERKVSGDTSVLEYVLDDNALAVVDVLKSKIKNMVKAAVSPDQPIYEAGAIISWLSPPFSINANQDTSSMDQRNALPVNVIAPDEGTYSYWSAHCDKANNNDYDITALLYLNNDFEGGELVFMDEEHDTVLHPMRARLVIFNSCVDNIHRVKAVTKGNRLLLSVWYSRQRK